MTSFELFLENLVNLNPWHLVKIGFLIFLALYFAFAIVIIRQVKLMIRVLNGAFELPLQVMALVHLALAATVFLLALTIL